jgi:hypothetical protein
LRDCEKHSSTTGLIRQPWRRIKYFLFELGQVNTKYRNQRNPLRMI